MRKARSESFACDGSQARRRMSHSGVWSRPPLARARLLLLSVLLLSACGETTQARVPSSVRVDPGSVDLDQGDRVMVTAVVVDQHGGAFQVPPPGFEIQWSSSTPGVASVHQGEIRGELPGEAVISARAGGLQPANVQVQVRALPIAGIQLYTSTNLLRMPETLQLIAYLYDARGNVVEGRQVTWTSHDPELASVSPQGVLTGHQAGWARISVSSEGLSHGIGFHIRPARCTGVPAGTIAVGVTVAAALGPDSCDSPFEGPWPTAAFAAPWRLEVAGTSSVEIEMISGEFQAVLYLSNPDLDLLAYATLTSPSGARISRSLEPGSYLVWASSFLANQKGGYQLSVR